MEEVQTCSAIGVGVFSAGFGVYANYTRKTAIKELTKAVNGGIKTIGTALTVVLD